MVEDPYESAAHPATPPRFQGESAGSLVLGAAIFAFAGFGMGWINTPAGQFSMWSLRILAVAFVVAIVFVLAVPRLGEILRFVVIALAAILLCSAGVWGLVDMGLSNITGWLLLVMGVFDAMEIVRYIAARRAVGE